MRPLARLAFLLTVLTLTSACVSEAAHAPTGWSDSYEPPASEAAFLLQADKTARGPALDATLAPDAPPTRFVIYSAELGLVVVSTSDAAERVQALAREAGGWLQESDGSSVTVRVPAEHFERVLAACARLGEVIARNVRAADVTEQRLDLDIRLENLQRARERLLEHLARSDSMENTLKIEAELTRVTGEIEGLEGRKRFLDGQIAMSTIRVQLNSRNPGGEEPGLLVPFEWIARLGDGLVAGTMEGRPRKPSLLAKGPEFDPPAGFLRYYSGKTLVEAMNADGLRLKVQRQDNFDEGALAFWKALARRALVETRALAVAEERELAPDRSLLRGTREVGGELQGYVLVLVRQKRYLYTFEAWGPTPLFDAAWPTLEESARSLEP